MRVKIDSEMAPKVGDNMTPERVQDQSGGSEFRGG